MEYSFSTHQYIIEKKSVNINPKAKYRKIKKKCPEETPRCP